MISINNIWNTEPLHQYNWGIYVVPPAAVSNLAEALTYRAKTVSIPDRSFDEVEIMWRRSKVKTLGRDSSPKTIDITGWLDVDLTLFSLINDWQNLVSDQETGLGTYKVDYYGEITVALFNNNDEVITNVTFYHCMPQSRQAISLDYGTSDPAELTITFAYDKHIFDNPNASTTQNFGE